MGYAAEQRRRLQAASFFKLGRRPAEVARQLGVSRQAASQWFAVWKVQGKQGLRGAGRTGRPRKLSDDQMAHLKVLLLQGPQAFGYATALWTLKRIARVIRKQWRVVYHPSHVWRLLGELGWSCQRPERRARERDEKAIRRWLRDDWPRIKKRLSNADPC
jgi:transposase